MDDDWFGMIGTSLNSVLVVLEMVNLARCNSRENKGSIEGMSLNFPSNYDLRRELE